MDLSKLELLIKKKENAEVYLSEIDNLNKEIDGIKQKITMSMLPEEKTILENDKKDIEDRISKYNSIYADKKVK